MDVKNSARKLIDKINVSSVLTKISFLCTMSFLIIFICTAAATYHVSRDIEDTVIFLVESSLRLLGLSFGVFVFSTGYHKELTSFFAVVIPISLFLWVIAAISIITYERSIRGPFGFVIIGFYSMGMLCAMIIRSVSVLIGKAVHRDKQGSVLLHIFVIIICALLLQVAFIFTLFSASGEDFSAV